MGRGRLGARHRHYRPYRRPCRVPQAAPFMSAAARLAELGIVLPEVVTPVGSYVPALRHGDLVYTSGQLPMVNGALVAVGQLGGEVTSEQGAECARAATLNALAAVAQACG